MNLYAKPTEQAILAAARRELRANPATWREFTRRRQRVKPLVWKFFAVVGLVIISATPLFARARTEPVKGAGVSAVVLFLLVCLLVFSLVQLLTKRAAQLERLPINDHNIFRSAWREQLLTTLWFLPSFAVFFHLFSSAPENTWTVPITAAALLLGTVHATLCVAMAWGRAAQWAPLIITYGMSFFWLFFMVVNDGVNPFLRLVADQFCAAVRYVTPTGWVLNWWLARPLGEADAALWLVPVAVVLGLAFPAWRRMRDTFVVAESTPRLPQLTPAQMMQMNYVAKHFPATEPPLIGATAIEESLRARGFLAPRRRPQPGVIDEWIWRRLTERERTLMDFLQLIPADWTRTWLLGLKLGAVGLLVALCLRESQPVIYWLPGVLAVLFAAVLMLPVTTGLSRAFLPCPVAGGAPLTLAGVLPMSYREVCVLDGKIAVVRALTALPLLLVFGALFALEIRVSPGLGLFVATKVVLASLLTRPVMVTFQFSTGTNDSQLNRLRGWFMLAGILFVTIVCFAGSAVATIRPEWWSLPLLLVPGALGYGFHGLHRHRYDHMRFDLQPSTLLGQHPVG